MRIVKGLIFYLVFCSLCVISTLGAMRIMTLHRGGEELFTRWCGEIREAFVEAGDFLAELPRGCSHKLKQWR